MPFPRKTDYGERKKAALLKAKCGSGLFSSFSQLQLFYIFLFAQQIVKFYGGLNTQ